jgi:hypothetical protein
MEYDYEMKMHEISDEQKKRWFPLTTSKSHIRRYWFNMVMFW